MILQIFISICLIAESAKPPVVPSKKFKLCGNENCDEVLFKSKVKRVMGVGIHEAFLTLTMGETVDVTGVKFSDRFDIMEGKLGDGSKGHFYISAIELGPYVEFLRNAVKTKKEMKVISQDRSDVGAKKFLGVLHADQHLVRDYNVQARNYAIEQKLPEPEMLPVPEVSATKGHGHSHLGHGHSHDHVGPNHSHNHEDHHGSSQLGQSSTITASSVDPKNTPLVTTTVPSVLVEDSKSDMIIQDKVDVTLHDDEIAKMIAADEALLKSQQSTMMDQVAETKTITDSEVIQEMTTAVPITDPLAENLLKEVNTVSSIQPSHIELPKQDVHVVNELTTPVSTEIFIAPPVDENVVSENSHEILVTTTSSSIDVQDLSTSLSSTDSALPTIDEGFCDRENCAQFNARVFESEEESLKQSEKIKEGIESFDDSWKGDFVNVDTGNQSNSRGTGVFGSVIKSITSLVRSVLPLGDIDDAGVGLVLNILFILIAFIIYLISYFMWDSGDSVVFDRMLCHDLATRIKTLQEQLKFREEEIRRLGATNGRNQIDADEIVALKTEVGLKQLEIQQLRSSYQLLETQLIGEREEHGYLETQLKIEKEQKAATEERAAEAIRMQESADRELEQIRSEYLSTKRALERVEQDICDERRRREEVLSEVQNEKKTTIKLSEELLGSQVEIKKLKQEKHEVELEVIALSSMLDKLEQNKKEGSAAGSVCWSDFGDDFTGDAEEEKKTHIPISDTGSNIRELAKLRAQQKNLEQEIEQARNALELEIEDRKAIEAKLERKKKEADEHDHSRKQADKRADVLLTMVNESNIKIKEAETVCKGLRGEVAKLQTELVSLNEEIRKKDGKIKELDFDAKKLRNDYLKLETKSFNEVMGLKHKLDALQTTQALPISAPNFDLLNMSGESMDHNIAPSRGALLWDEPSCPSVRNKTTSPEDLMSSTMPVLKRGSRSRRSDRVQRDISPSDVERKREKDGTSRRVRSRSQCRQPYIGMSGMMGGPIPPYISNGPGFPPMQHDLSLGMGFPEPLNRRHSRSGRVYYSSGGSNSGRSPPPPEMPLLSAIPPPGLKKPTGKRAVLSLSSDFKTS